MRSRQEEQIRELPDYFAATRRLGNINLSVKLKAVPYRWPLFAAHNPTGKTSRVTFQRDSPSRSRCIERFSVWNIAWIKVDSRQQVLWENRRA